MAKQLELHGRRYWILSEPTHGGWRAKVVEIQSDSSTDELGIEATGETRGVADDSAERKLRRMLQAS